MQDIYKFAAQETVRYPSIRGDLTTEQLFQLPLKSKTGFDLDSVARMIHRSLKSESEESFVEQTSVDPYRVKLEIAFAVVKDVIATKQEENKAEVARQNKSVQRKKILDAMAAKKDAALTTASMEELEKELAALDQ